MKEKFHHNRLAILAIILVFCAFVGIGAAYLAQALFIGGTGTISSDFKVEFQDPVETTGAALGTATVTGEKNDTVTFTVTLKKPGDSYVATVDVKNTGKLDAKYIGITVVTAPTLDENVILTFNTTTAANTVLKAEDDEDLHTFTFTFTWTDTGDVQDALDAEYTFSYKINYQQA